MPRKKKETMDKPDVREAFINCKTYTQTQVATALAEICNNDQGIDRETARRIADQIETVINVSFSRVMASSGL